MKLQRLLESIQDLFVEKVSLEHLLGGEPKEITHITSDTRDLVPQSLFIAVHGTRSDGADFILDARKNGATLVIGEGRASGIPSSPDIQVTDARLALARIASTFYENPSKELKIIGVTGTSGKTTTTYLLESIFEAAGEKVGVIGTVNFRYAGKILPATHTTPGAVELQKLLKQMKDEGVTTVIMEVSSHALKMKRADCIAFDAALFTNLTPEHLDFHPDMEDYFNSKSRLFTELLKYSVEQGKKPIALIESQDKFGKRLFEICKKSPSIKTFSFGLRSPFDYHADFFQFGLDGISGKIGDSNFHLPLVGPFNVLNTLAALGTAEQLQVPTEVIAQGLSRLKTVPGRLEKIPNDQSIHVFVDYAHKPDALEKVLEALRSTLTQKGRLITVFGCGGDRDRTKRPKMGEIACRLSDWVFITSDNPRTEDPNKIIEEILSGIPGKKHFTVEPERKKAIELAVASARSNDVIVIAGKGHEDYQIIADPTSETGTRKIHFDDREVAFKAIHRYLIFGMGKSGADVARYLVQTGADVAITDQKPETELKSLSTSLRANGVEVVFKNWQTDASDLLKRASTFVLSPGVSQSLPLFKEAKKQGHRFTSEIEIGLKALKNSKEIIIGITGTSGKTTTTTLIGEMLKSDRRSVFIGGNIGTPLVQYLMQSQKVDFVVVELSSFQLELLNEGQVHVSVFTSLGQDHLDRYESFEHYAQTKRKLIDKTIPEGHVVLPFEHPLLSRFSESAKSQVFWNASHRSHTQNGAYWDSQSRKIYYKNHLQKVEFDLSHCKLQGTHNIENLMSALCAVIPLGVRPEAIQNVINEFPGLPHRIEFVREISGVRYYNDSKATNAVAVQKSLASFADKKVIWIAGGKEKGIDYSPLQSIVQKKCKRAILIGEAQGVLEKSFANIVDTERAVDLKSALERAHLIAEPQDIVLLSPGCSSFDQFKSYEDRGNQFKSIVMAGF